MADFSFCHFAMTSDWMQIKIDEFSPAGGAPHDFGVLFSTSAVPQHQAKQQANDRRSMPMCPFCSLAFFMKINSTSGAWRRDRQVYINAVPPRSAKEDGSTARSPLIDGGIVIL